MGGGRASHVGYGMTQGEVSGHAVTRGINLRFTVETILAANDPRVSSSSSSAA